MDANTDKDTIKTITEAMRAGLAAAIKHAGGIPAARYDHATGGASDPYVIVYGTRQNGKARVQVTAGGRLYDAPVREDGKLGSVRSAPAWR
jgi:hypothetical protein